MQCFVQPLWVRLRCLNTVVAYPLFGPTNRLFPPFASALMGEKVQTAEAQEEGTGTFLFLPPHSPFSHILFLVLQYMYR